MRSETKKENKMGRYYNGDIEGKFWVAVQSSDDADFFGQAGEPNEINYHFEKENITEVKEKLLECLKVLGSSKPKMDKFFKVNDFYNNEMLYKEYGWTEEETRKNLEWYARYELGKKIYKHLKNNDDCYFSAEL
jgi:hypothetical protein